MGEETLLVALFGGLHLLGFGFAALLLLPCLHDEQTAPLARRDDEDSGGGGNDRLGPIPPRGPRDGGIPMPLPDAEPASVRLRERGRLADLLPAHERRPAHSPTPSPTRTPTRR